MHLRQDVKLNGISPFFVIKYHELSSVLTKFRPVIRHRDKSEEILGDRQ